MRNFSVLFFFIVLYAKAQVIPPSITIGDLADSIYCHRSVVNIPYSTNLAFGSNNKFFAQILDLQGLVIYSVEVGIGSNQNNEPFFYTNIPEILQIGVKYKYQIYSSSPSIYSNISNKPFNIISKPPNISVTNIIPNTPAIIPKGGSASLTATMDSLFPYDVKSEAFGFNIPAGLDKVTFSVSPQHTTFYNNSFYTTTGGCETFSSISNAVVIVDAPLKIGVEVPSKYFCGGYNGQINLNMTLDGNFTPQTKFSILLSDSTGINNFQPIPVRYSSSSTIGGYIPSSYPSGKNYRAKIVSINPNVESEITSSFEIIHAPTMTFTGTQTIFKGDTAILRADMTGSGPWKFYVSNILKPFIFYETPFLIKVAPQETTTYQIQTMSLWNSCYSDSTLMSIIERPIVTVIPKPVDLSLKMVSYNKIATIGEIVVHQIVIKNESKDKATNVIVKLKLSEMLAYYHHNAQGIFNITDSLWRVGDLNPSDTAVLYLSLKVLSQGIGFTEAEVYQVNEPDLDSTPNNSIDTEDDFAQTCVSVPLSICPNQILEVKIPSKYSNVQWFKDGQPIGNTNILVISTSGTYTFKVNNFSCPAEGCCPLIITLDNCCPSNICIPFVIVKKL